MGRLCRSLEAEIGLRIGWSLSRYRLLWRWVSAAHQQKKQRKKKQRRRVVVWVAAVCSVRCAGRNALHSLHCCQCGLEELWLWVETAASHLQHTTQHITNTTHKQTNKQTNKQTKHSHNQCSFTTHLALIRPTNKPTTSVSLSFSSAYPEVKLQRQRQQSLRFAPVFAATQRRSDVHCHYHHWIGASVC